MQLYYFYGSSPLISYHKLCCLGFLLWERIYSNMQNGILNDVWPHFERSILWLFHDDDDSDCQFTEHLDNHGNAMLVAYIRAVSLPDYKQWKMQRKRRGDGWLCIHWFEKTSESWVSCKRTKNKQKWRRLKFSQCLREGIQESGGSGTVQFAMWALYFRKWIKTRFFIKTSDVNILFASHAFCGDLFPPSQYLSSCVCFITFDQRSFDCLLNCHYWLVCLLNCWCMLFWEDVDPDFNSLQSLYV